MKRINSKIDGSVNWIIPFKKSFFECRYVRRRPDYISAYVSSHNGCKMACKFCWLTATNQTEFNHTNHDQYNDQLDTILNYSKTIDLENSQNIRINVNMMARGEALSNKYIINEYPLFYNNMCDITKKYNYQNTKINLSTIMPNTIKQRNLIDIFHDKPINIYYSLYSIKDKFRKEWLPNAMDWELALKKLHDFENLTNNPIAFHFAIIEGENDNLNEIKEMATIINNMKFKKTKFNIVRFNPHESLKYNEPSEEKLNEIYDILKSVAQDSNILTNKTRIVPRADIITKASCGVFITKEEYDDL